MKKDIVNPTTLKGQDQMNHIRSLMGKVAPVITESKVNSVLEISHKGPDGKVYGIVRENHEYYIKTTKSEGLNVTDYEYLGGLKNKKEFAFESYAKATKQLKLKLMSLTEAYGVTPTNDTNILLKEDAAGFASTGSGFSENVFEEEEIEENNFVEEDDSCELEESADPDELSDFVDESFDEVNERVQRKFGITKEEAKALMEVMVPLKKKA